MTAVVSLLPAAGTSRPSAPPLGLLTAIEVRKSLSTRSGKAVGVLATLIGPVGVALVSLEADGTAPGAAIIGVTGMLSALVLLALGVLSTAGEWTHRSVQVTYLLVPRRLRVLTAKVVGLALQGAVFAAVGAALTTAVLWGIVSPVDWSRVGTAVPIVVAAGAAFAVVGAGVGAALANSPAALTGTYLVMLGVMPILQAFRPTWAENVDPTTPIVMMAEKGVETRPVLVIVGWVVLSVVVGAMTTRRRSVS